MRHNFGMVYRHNHRQDERYPAKNREYRSNARRHRADEQSNGKYR